MFNTGKCLEILELKQKSTKFAFCFNIGYSFEKYMNQSSDLNFFFFIAYLISVEKSNIRVLPNFVLIFYGEDV